MTFAPRYEPDPTASHMLVRQRRLQRILESYGVLTRDRLRELAGADSWHAPFALTLVRATRAGRVRRLSEELYAAGRER